MGIIQMKLCGDLYGHAQPVARGVDEYEVCDVVLWLVKRVFQAVKNAGASSEWVVSCICRQIISINNHGTMLHTTDIPIIDSGRQT
jgi:hypothetical protein